MSPKQLAYALAPETSRFSALEEAVGIREVPEAVELASKAPMFASKEPSDDDVFSTKLESGSGHFIDLSELAAGNMPPSNNILETHGFDRCGNTNSDFSSSLCSTPQLQMTLQLLNHASTI